MKDAYQQFENFVKYLRSRGLFRDEDAIERYLSRFLRRLEKESMKVNSIKGSISWYHHWRACNTIGSSIVTFGKKKNTDVGVDYLNSMVFVRLNEIERLLIEYRILYMTCSYYSISRQLRFMLESVIQAYYIDTEYPKIGMLGKLSVLKQMKRDRKAIGRPLVNMTNLDLGVKEKIISLYRELSDVVHPDYQDYIPFARPEEKEDYFNWISRLVLLPNPQLANYCLEKLNEVMDIVYFLIFESFGSVALIGLPRFEEVLHKANCELSLHFVYKHQDSIH